MAAQPVATAGARLAEAKRGRESAREREGSVVQLGAFCRQGWRGMGAGRAAPAARVHSDVVKLGTVAPFEA
jgi:hypothetical protein